MSVRRSARLRSKLAEQLVDLSTPNPISFHPDEDDLNDETAAKVCDFMYEEEEGHHQISVGNGIRTTQVGKELEEDLDPKYAGNVVSRRELDMEMEGLDSESDLNSDLSEMGDLFGTTLDRVLNVDNEIATDENEYASSSDENSNNEGGTISNQSEEEGSKGDMTTFSMMSLKDDIEKGKAAKKQTKLMDGLLETRIKLQGALSLANQFPAPKCMPLFLKEGGLPLEQSLDETCRHLHQLLGDLIQLQTLLLTKSKETQHLISGTSQPSSGKLSEKEEEDEEIPSNSEDEMSGEEEGDNMQFKTAGRRKRKRFDSCTIPEGERDFEREIDERHGSIRPYRDAVISKWNEKTRLSSGKITSKSFMDVDRSILSQIEHVLKDKERLRKRTQLKRSVYKILGELEDDEEEEKEADRRNDQLPSERDSHLKDHNENIFDDDDFYHQLLRELIERKTNCSESSDPIEMGKQWLELQRLRTKAKKKVDTKASKGRKIRYNVHPKLVSFMAPVEKGAFTDTSKNDLFSSLFGLRYTRHWTTHTS